MLHQAIQAADSGAVDGISASCAEVTLGPTVGPWGDKDVVARSKIGPRDTGGCAADIVLMLNT